MTQEWKDRINAKLHAYTEIANRYGQMGFDEDSPYSFSLEDYTLWLEDKLPDAFGKLRLEELSDEEAEVFFWYVDTHIGIIERCIEDQSAYDVSGSGCFLELSVFARELLKYKLVA